jgi:DNA polymerase III delta prime subunit
VKRLAENKELTAQINKSCTNIARIGKLEIQRLQETLSYIAKTSNLKLPAKVEETKAEKQLAKIVPKRLFKGTLSNDLLKERLGEKEYEWYQEIDEKDPDFSKKMLEIVNFADGKRDAQNIVKAISAEYTPTESEYMIKLLNDLKKAKLIVFK